MEPNWNVSVDLDHEEITVADIFERFMRALYLGSLVILGAVMLGGCVLRDLPKYW